MHFELLLPPKTSLLHTRAATPALRLWRRLSGLRGAIDRIEGATVTGWAAQRGASPPLTVELHCADGRLATLRAAAYRADLEGAGIGTGRHGFSIALPPPLIEAVHAGGWIALRQAQAGPEIARLELGTEAHASGKGSPLARHLFGPLLRLGDPVAHDARPDLSRHRALFSNRAAAGPEALPAPLFAYLDFVRHRDARPETFPPEHDAEQIGELLRWYLDEYGARRTGLQTPLSRAAIDWLNTEENGITRAIGLFDPHAPDRERAIAHWATELAPSLDLADCLISETHRAHLCEPLTSDPFALNHFTRHLHTTIPALGALDPTQSEDRRTLTLAVMALALEQPAFLWFVPRTDLDTLLDSGAFSNFATDLCPGTSASRSRYGATLRATGFDLDTRSFLRSPEGHRIEAARLPVSSDEPVDIQILGPFHKAAGLGQSTRLSQAILGHTPYSLHAVDIARDNPTPSRPRIETGAARPACINLLHLNAEAVPAALAYEPDIFSGAYTIAYVYWELDSPALCHHLALDLVDEIWVSSEYCAEIYRGATTKPVTNVGMCFEEPPAVERAEARHALHARLELPASAFTLLTSFDSFSFLQRKNPLGTLRAFGAAFPDDPESRLILKSQNRAKVRDPAQAALWAEIDREIAADPRILLLDETMDYSEVLRLIAGADGYLSLHRSEGWGFGMLEAMALGTPVLCTGYSGNLEFCDPQTAWLVPADLVEVGPQDYIFARHGQHWGEPDLAVAIEQLRAFRSDPELRRKKAAQAQIRVRRDFSASAIARRYEARLREIFAELDAR